MKKYFNKLLHEIGVKAHGSSSTRVLDLPTGSTVLIHIGKCGGSTVRDGIENATRNFISHEVHIKKPVYRPDLKYIIVPTANFPRFDRGKRSRIPRQSTDVGTRTSPPFARAEEQAIRDV